VTPKQNLSTECNFFGCVFRELYVLCSQFGSVLDVVALKTPKMRGQAFVVFQDLRGDASQLVCVLELFDDIRWLIRSCLHSFD
jgi:hypothetical protein